VHFTYNAQTGYIDADKTCKEILDAAKTISIIGIEVEERYGNLYEVYSPIAVNLHVDTGHHIDMTLSSFASDIWGGALSVYCPYSDDNTIWTIPD
jgi:hypothetical protein